MLNDNVAYKQLEIAWQRTEFEAMEIMTWVDMVNSQGLNDIAVMGYFEREANIVEAVPVITGAKTINLLTNESHFVAFSKYYLNRDYNVVSAEKKKEISDSEKYANMPVYPNYGCVDIIDGIVVIKLGHDELN